MIKPKPNAWQRFWRSVEANSALVALLAFLLASAALAVTGIYLMFGLAWALIAGSVTCLFGASFLRFGMVAK